MNKGTLIFLCGKMGAGKSTAARKIASERGGVLLSEDEWLQSIYPEKIVTLNDYVKYSRLLKPQMEKLVLSILATGADVVMDFPANTKEQRKWFKEIFTQANSNHRLLYIDVPNEVCLARIRNRRKTEPDREATDTSEMFELVTKHFVSPTRDEEFKVTKITQ